MQLKGETRDSVEGAYPLPISALMWNKIIVDPARAWKLITARNYYKTIVRGKVVIETVDVGVRSQCAGKHLLAVGVSQHAEINESMGPAIRCTVYKDLVYAHAEEHADDGLINF